MLICSLLYMQPICDITLKPSSRMLLLSARSAVSFQLQSIITLDCLYCLVNRSNLPRVSRCVTVELQGIKLVTSRLLVHWPASYAADTCDFVVCLFIVIAVFSVSIEAQATLTRLSSWPNWPSMHSVSVPAMMLALVRTLMCFISQRQKRHLQPSKVIVVNH